LKNLPILTQLLNDFGLECKAHPDSEVSFPNFFIPPKISYSIKSEINQNAFDELVFEFEKKYGTRYMFEDEDGIYAVEVDFTQRPIFSTTNKFKQACGEIIFTPLRPFGGTELFCVVDSTAAKKAVNEVMGYMIEFLRETLKCIKKEDPHVHKIKNSRFVP
jgi:hypothetical protein